jgi:hypothetical protein
MDVTSVPDTLKVRAAEMVDITHPQLSPSWQLTQSYERLRSLKCSVFRGKKDHELA